MAGTTLSNSTDDCLSALATLGPMRVWSVVITIFGDAVAKRGGVVPAAALQPILDKLSIRPEAMRVALHRLVKEGWIERLKQGRTSSYALTKEGRDAFLPATERIYAKGPSDPSAWPVVALPQMPEPERARMAKALRGAGCFALSPHFFLGAPGQSIPEDVGLVAQAKLETMPSWAKEAIAPAALRQDYQMLLDVLRKLDKHSPSTPLDAVALRILLIHQWRRCLLRHPDVPVRFLPTDWQGEACRAFVLKQWNKLSVTGDPWLDKMIGPRAT